MPFAYGALTHCGATFQNASARHQICNSVKGLAPLLSGPATPNWQRHQALPPARFGLLPFRSPLLRESLLLSIPRGTDMFQFPRFPLPALCVQTGVTPHDGCRVSPFGHPRIEAWSTAPRGLSQPPTSFFGFRRQGIHRWLFVAWEQRCSCSLCSFQGALEGREVGAHTASSARPAFGSSRREHRLEPRIAARRRSLKTEQRRHSALALPSREVQDLRPAGPRESRTSQ